MQRPRTHTLRSVGVFFIVLLTLVPLALTGHFHAHARAMHSPCALCVVVHHVPAAPAGVAPYAAPVLHSFHFIALPIGAPVQVFRPFRAGRAPPAASRISVV